MFLVEGNIGVGKSTFLKLLTTHIPEIEISYEPLQQWHNKIDSRSLLNSFYENPHRWAYTMEINTMLTRLQEHLKQQTTTGGIKVIERSIYSGYCFAQNSYKSGFLSKVEWQLYLELFTLLVSQKCKPPYGFIYLKVDPVIAFERIKRRNRDAEKNISLNYIQQIHECHEDFLIRKIINFSVVQHIPILILNVEKEFESNPAQLIYHAQEVQEFIKKNTHELLC